MMVGLAGWQAHVIQGAREAAARTLPDQGQPEIHSKTCLKSISQSKCWGDVGGVREVP